ncbi:MAG: hypothetical protein FWG81_04295 [Betaproteobacteria bacterium]|nr:hypothetical protein [Betaproteobacteria bacterium]
MGKLKTLLSNTEQWQQTVEYLYFLHQTKWTSWENHLWAHEFAISYFGIARLTEEDLRISWRDKREKGPVVEENNWLWIANGTHRLFIPGDILVVTGSNGMGEKYGMSGVTSKGVRLNHYYIPLRSYNIHPAIKGCIIFAISAHMGRASKSQTLIAGSIVLSNGQVISSVNGGMTRP